MSSHHIFRVLAVCSVLLLTVSVLPRSIAAQGNSDNAHACQKGGWASLARADDPDTPFANQDECVSYGAHGGQIVAVQEAEISLTFRPIGADLCVVEVHLRHFAPSTTYTVEHFSRNRVTGVEVPAFSLQITTDTAGSADYQPFLGDATFETRAVTTGVDSGWTAIAC